MCRFGRDDGGIVGFGDGRHRHDIRRATRAGASQDARSRSGGLGRDLVGEAVSGRRDILRERDGSVRGVRSDPCVSPNAFVGMCRFGRDGGGIVGCVDDRHRHDIRRAARTGTSQDARGRRSRLRRDGIHIAMLVFACLLPTRNRLGRTDAADVVPGESDRRRPHGGKRDR